jgi:uncharacterized protein YcbK (DUF882 family)
MRERDTKSHLVHRRAFLRAGLGAVAGCLAPRLASASAAGSEARSLAFHSLHTGEKLRVVYFERGAYVSDALSAVDHVLRDFRTGEVREISRGLLDLLHRLSLSLETSAPFEVISGYRSPATNSSLRKAGRGVASGSLHMTGWAADVRVPGRELAAVRRAALDLRAGGVGYYPDSDFVHVDVGRVRFW